MSSTSTAKHRIVILTEIISPYRIPVFNVLARDPEIEPHVIFLAETDASLREWRVYKEEIEFSYEVLRSRRWKLGKRNVLLNRGVGAALKKAAPESILCGGYNYLASWEALLWARREEVPFLLWSESNRQDERGGHAAIEFLKREFLKRCAGFVVPGKSALAYLRSLGVAGDKVVTAPNAVDNDFFMRGASVARREERTLRAKLGLPPRYILYAGRLVREKGVFDLLEAYAGLDVGIRSKVALVYAGDGVARSELKNRARQVVPGVVLFPGFAQREALAQLYGLAEALVLPTHSDTWGLVVNEAMASGLPVVVSDVAGCVPDLVEDGWNGYVVPVRAPERLAEALKLLLRNSEGNVSMRRHSSERIQNYSPETCAKGLAEAAVRCAMEAR